MDDITKLLQKANSLLGNKTPPPVKEKSAATQPYRALRFFSFLCHEEPKDPIWVYAHRYFWEDMTMDSVPEGIENPVWIYHNHAPTKVCSSPCFCHLQGYSPKETDSSSFKYQFSLAWKGKNLDEK